jgi:uncharacterized protein YraI
MSLRPLFLTAASVFAALALSATADAGWGHTDVSVVLYTGPGISHDRLLTIPAGARVEIYQCQGWCEVGYEGYRGWADRGCIKLDYLHTANSLVFASPVRAAEGTYLTPVAVPRQPAYLASSPLRPPSDERANWYEGRIFYFNGRYLDHADSFYILGH